MLFREQHIEHFAVISSIINRFDTICSCQLHCHRRSLIEWVRKSYHKKITNRTILGSETGNNDISILLRSSHYSDVTLSSWRLKSSSTQLLVQQRLLTLTSNRYQRSSFTCVFMGINRWNNDVIKWNLFPRYWPFVLTKDQQRGALMFYLICAWINGLANNWNTSVLRRHCAHYDVTVMIPSSHRLIPLKKGR